MADYSKTTNFTAKDNLTTGDPLKVIKGSYFDTEFDNIATAITTKYDSDNVATQAQAEGLALDSVLLTPHSLNDVLVDNAGALGDLQALTVAGFAAADAIFGWDDSSAVAIGFTLGTGLTTTLTEIELDFLGLEDLVDPDADRIYFWDDTAGLSQWLVVGGGIEIDNATSTLQIADVAATTTNPIDIASGAFDIDLEALDTIEGNALAATDTFLVDDGGVPKGIEYQDMGLTVQTAQTTQTLAATDMNTIMEFNGTATITLPFNATTALPVGASVIIVVDHATQEVTVTASASVTLNSIFHPGGTAAASDVVMSGGMAVLTKVATDEWYLSGDIKDT